MLSSGADSCSAAASTSDVVATAPAAAWNGPSQVRAAPSYEEPQPRSARPWHPSLEKLNARERDTPMRGNKDFVNECDQSIVRL